MDYSLFQQLSAVTSAARFSGTHAPVRYNCAWVFARTTNVTSFQRSENIDNIWKCTNQLANTTLQFANDGS